MKSIKESLLAGLLFAFLALLLPGQPATAHHSFAMFDFEKTVQIEGVVKELRFTNPHIWLYVLVTDPKYGRTVEYGIEGAAPNTLLRAGWKRDTLKAGDTVRVAIHPLRNGEPGGSLVTVQANDRTLGNAP